MSISFDPEVIYKNAFHAFRRDDCYLYKHDIVKFCDILREEISKINGLNTEYKYPHFDFSHHSLNSFFEAYFGVFNIIGEYIYSSKAVGMGEIEKVNRPYDECIKKALNDTRRIFNDMLSKGKAKK